MSNNTSKASSMQPFPLYSVVVDGVEVATVGSDDDAILACKGRPVRFVDKKVPENIRREPHKEYIQEKGYYIPS